MYAINLYARFIGVYLNFDLDLNPAGLLFVRIDVRKSYATIERNEAGKQASFNVTGSSRSCRLDVR